MMKDHLIGRCVTDIIWIHDYVQVCFGENSRLTILNNFRGDLSALVSAAVMDVEGSDSELSIHFDNGQTLSIGLSDDDYNGPESFRFFDHLKGINVINQ